MDQGIESNKRVDLIQIWCNLVYYAALALFFVGLGLTCFGVVDFSPPR